MRIAVCDDDPVFLARIVPLLEARTKGRPDSSVSSYLNGDSLINAHAANAFDVILLDVVMPMENGIEVAREIRTADKNVKIIFLTSSREFAVESYLVKASNYLVKPVNAAALLHCLDELEEEMRAEERRIAIRAAHSVHSINPAAIEHLEARGKHVDVVLANGEVIEAIESLCALEERLLLDDGFFKCHRSYIVNINHIGTYETEGITMRSGRKIPVSRGCRAGFKEVYFSVLFGKDGDGTW